LSYLRGLLLILWPFRSQRTGCYAGSVILASTLFFDPSISIRQRSTLLCNQAEFCPWEEGRLEGSALRAFVESFATDALGLKLGDPISDKRQLPHLLEGVRDRESPEDGSVGFAWQTDRGAFIALVRYDEARSALVKAHVFYLDWKIGSDHHGGWYHAYPKFPRDWIKGPGRENRC
jgi:hypothetical protein